MTVARYELRSAAELDALARASRMRVLPNPELPVAGTYLVDRERVGKFADLLGEVDEALDQVDLVCTAPWPNSVLRTGAQAGRKETKISRLFAISYASTQSTAWESCHRS